MQNVYNYKRIIRSIGLERKLTVHRVPYRAYRFIPCCFFLHAYMAIHKTAITAMTPAIVSIIVSPDVVPDISSYLGVVSAYNVLPKM